MDLLEATSSAAETHVDRSLLDSALFIRTNIEGARVLLEVAVRYGINRFLQVSTDEVYGLLAPDEPAFSEDSPLLPNSPYASSKAAADVLVRTYYGSYRVPTLITRCGNNYGPYQFPEKFLPLFITNALYDESLPLYGDGKQIRDWIHVEDHARAVLHVLQHGAPGEIYNVSAHGERTNQFMAEWVLDILGKPRELIRHVEDRPGHDRRYALNASKIRPRLAAVCFFGKRLVEHDRLVSKSKTVVAADQDGRISELLYGSVWPAPKNRGVALASCWRIN